MQTSHAQYINEVKSSKIYTLNQTHSFPLATTKKVALISLSILSLIIIGYTLQNNNSSSNMTPIELTQNNTPSVIEVTPIQTQKNTLPAPIYTTAKKPSSLVTTVSYVPTSNLEERFMKELKAIK